MEAGPTVSDPTGRFPPATEIGTPGRHRGSFTPAGHEVGGGDPDGSSGLASARRDTRPPGPGRQWRRWGSLAAPWAGVVPRVGGWPRTATKSRLGAANGGVHEGRCRGYPSEYRSPSPVATGPPRGVPQGLVSSQVPLGTVGARFAPGWVVPRGNAGRCNLEPPGGLLRPRQEFLAGFTA